jgi:hypothetical protein
MSGLAWVSDPIRDLGDDTILPSEASMDFGDLPIGYFGSRPYNSV